MSLGICLITAGLARASSAIELLRRCGITIWTPDAGDGHIYERAICLVVDMPGISGVETLCLLRAYGVRTPALLVVDSGFSPDPAVLNDAWVLNVIPRTADPRELLHWIESMCITRKLLERLRNENGVENRLMTETQSRATSTLL